jgi:CubicO group peptidase (beta-lactamase class C family)
MRSEVSGLVSVNRRSLIAGGAALALAPGCASSPLRSAASFDPVAALARDAVAKSLAPGVSIMVAGRGGTIYEHATGWADIDANVAIRPDHLFRVYSQTKAVTAVCALILAEDGRLRLDDPVSAYIPAFARTQVYVSGDRLENLRVEPQARPMSVRDLMRHSAGIIYRHDSGYPVSALYVARGIDSGSGERFTPSFSSLAAMVDTLAEIPLAAQPGAKFTYGNASDVLGRVVEVASGKRLRAFAAERIFAPLGMTSSMFEVPAALAPRLTCCYAGLAAPRERDPVLDLVNPADLRPGALRIVDHPAASAFAAPRPIDFGGAGLVCSAADYLRFANMLAQGGALGGERILKREAVAAMGASQLGLEAMQNPGLQRLGLGFGLSVATYVDPTKAPAGVPASVRFWGGAASTLFWFDPERQISGVIMAQVFGGDFRAYHIPMVREVYTALNAA